jgi:hypothetical protein
MVAAGLFPAALGLPAWVLLFAIFSMRSGEDGRMFFFGFAAMVLTPFKCYK